MKIAYISGSTIPSGKANAVHVMKMCQALARHQKSCVTLYGKRGSWFQNPYDHYGVKPSFKLVRSWFGTLSFLSGSLRLLVLFIHAGFIKKPDAYYGRDALGLYFISLFRRPLFYEAHQVPQGKFSRFIVTRLLKSPALKGVVVISKGLKKDFKKEFSFSQHPLLVAHDGADILTKTPMKIPQKLWLGRRNILQVGYTGSLHTGRGLEMIVDVAHLIPEMDFHVIGGTRAQKETWLKKGLPSNLFMHGSKPHADIPSYLAKFDIVLAPYHPKIHIGTGADIAKWISPMKLFEYMASSTPIVCSDLPALREIIEHGRNGLMVKSDDPTAWVDALCTLSKSTDHRTSIGQEGLKDIQNHFSWNIRADNVTQFMKKHI